jgi:MFS family permease
MAFLAFGSAHGFVLLAVTALTAGLTFDLYRPAMSALVIDVVPEPAQRKVALSVLYLALNIGRGVACIVGRVVASQAFWVMFVANAVINVAFGVAVLRTIKVGGPPKTPRTPVPLRVAFRDSRLVAFTAVTLAFYVVHMQSVIALPMVIAQHGTSPWQFGLLLALDPLIVAVVQLAVQRRLMSTTALHACAIGVAMVGVGLAIAAAGSGLGWYALTMPLWIAGEVIFLAVAQDVVAAIAPPDRIATYIGCWGLSQGLAALIAPALAAVLTAIGGAWLLWTAGAGLALAAAAACLALQRQQQRRLASAFRLMLTRT